jgi:DNA repair protein RadC
MRVSMSPRRLVDLRVFGAATMSDRELIRLVCGPRVEDDEVTTVASALELAPAAREGALLDSPHGPRLLAALELGRRAGRAPSSAAARLDSPGALVAALAQRLGEDQSWWVVAMDVRLRLARAVPLGCGGDLDAWSSLALAETLRVGCRRFAVARRLVGPAVFSADDRARFAHVRDRAAPLGIRVLDAVVIGDDGWCSLVRQGHVALEEHRYR